MKNLLSDNELCEFYERENKVRKEVASLESLLNKCYFTFAWKALEKQLSGITTIQDLLDRRISTKQLLDVLELAKAELQGYFLIIARCKKYGQKYYNEILNYNEVISLLLNKLQ